MSPLLRRGSAKQKHEARLAYLSAHPEKYSDVPGIHEDVTDAGRFALDALCLEMRAGHMFGASSSPDTQRETIRRLVSELRGESVRGGW